MALPRTRLGYSSDSTTQLSGASVRVNAPVGTNMAANVKAVGSLKAKFRNINTWPQAIASVPTIRIGRRPNCRVSQKAMIVHNVIQTVMITLLRMASGAVVKPASMNSVGV